MSIQSSLEQPKKAIEPEKQISSLIQLDLPEELIQLDDSDDFIPSPVHFNAAVTIKDEPKSLLDDFNDPMDEFKDAIESQESLPLEPSHEFSVPDDFTVKDGHQTEFPVSDDLQDEFPVSDDLQDELSVSNDFQHDFPVPDDFPVPKNAQDEFPVPNNTQDEFPVPNDAQDEFPVPDDFPENDQDDFNEFDDGFDNEFDDGFVDADNDDDFGDFDDFEPAVVEPKTPTDAELFNNVLEHPEDMKQFLEGYLNKIWDTEPLDEEHIIQNDKNMLSTSCSRDLWSKLSRDTVFYNPVTGSVGQFQWTRSETNKHYLNALGVTFNQEKLMSPVTKKRHSNLKMEGIKITTTLSNPSSPTVESPQNQTYTSPQTHTRSVSSHGLKVVTSKIDETSKEAKKEADQELDLDIDIARAYCELTEDTIRIFPDVKLNSMVTELTRLQKQAGHYLETLLDQREQLKMDAETYNDLISCIVGHAQRLHVQNKDASPAMVTKTKKPNSTFSNIMKRKTTTSAQSVSMGGGVVGLKKQPTRALTANPPMVTTSNPRRSM